jgi:hypothetical protein
MEQHLATINQRLSKIETALVQITNLLNTFITTSGNISPSKSKLSKQSSPKSNIKIIKSGNATVTVYPDQIIITGKTFDNKEFIKQIGGKWSKDHKGWQLPRDKDADVRTVMDTYFLKCNYQEKHTPLNVSNETNNYTTESEIAPVNSACAIESGDDSDSD